MRKSETAYSSNQPHRPDWQDDLPPPPPEMLEQQYTRPNRG